ncbi:MAG: hypothetical protein FRX48_01659 [Lasallia pustulata]|uniref:Amidoligase enzyme n=1 Tax=Lasallia pustulata TaxID=136370 RepID=A0A5M8PYN0_9LECA|nr:MAG: hypothetical protein FRX48_01659 [Lasallia pustulata]
MKASGKCTMWLDGPLRSPTFGVEIEFIVRHQQNGLQDLYQPHIHEQLRQHLSDEDVKVNSIYGTHGYSAWTVTGDVSILPYGDGEDINRSLTHTAVELISPVLPVGPLGFQEIHKVVALVQVKFDVKVNQSTGLHVHVGNGSDNIDDQCIQNLAQLVTVFQYQIDSIHPDSRINAYWAMPPSSSAALRVSEGPFATAEVLQRDERETIGLINPGGERAVAYNFTNLVDPWSGKRTIEFRQHQGSLNAEQIVAWAEFVTALRFASHASHRQAPFGRLL